MIKCTTCIRDSCWDCAVIKNSTSTHIIREYFGAGIKPVNYCSVINLITCCACSAKPPVICAEKQRVIIAWSRTVRTIIEEFFAPIVCSSGVGWPHVKSFTIVTRPHGKALEIRIPCGLKRYIFGVRVGLGSRITRNILLHGGSVRGTRIVRNCTQVVAIGFGPAIAPHASCRACKFDRGIRLVLEIIGCGQGEIGRSCTPIVGRKWPIKSTDVRTICLLGIKVFYDWGAVICLDGMVVGGGIAVLAGALHHGSNSRPWSKSWDIRVRIHRP